MLYQRSRLLFLILGLGLSNAVWAKSESSNIQIFNTINQVLNVAKDNDMVRMRGYLSQREMSDNYILTDGKNTLDVSINDDLMLAQALHPKVKTELRGRVKKHIDNTSELKVTNMLIITTQ
jgi:uncharacterized protein YdeI (BOF family)